MQIESLKVFCDLAETESFTKAAQINSVTQSAVSQQISSLERQFKSLLIELPQRQSNIKNALHRIDAAHFLLLETFFYWGS